MMSLLYLNTPLWLDGQVPPEKFKARFNPIGPSGKSWQWKMALLLKGTYIIIPNKKCQAMLNLIHEGHLGLNKCKLRAKDTVYWPGLNEELEKLVLNCELCLKYSFSKCKQKSSQCLGQEIPVHPWTKLATDIFHFESSSYLVDSGIYKQISQLSTSCLWWQVYMLQTNANKSFSEYGWPETLISNNGPCYIFTSLHQCYAVLQCKSYYQLSALPAVKWSCWEVCSDCEKLILQS